VKESARVVPKDRSKINLEKKTQGRKEGANNRDCRGGTWRNYTEGRNITAAKSRVGAKENDQSEKLSNLYLNTQKNQSGVGRT